MDFVALLVQVASGALGGNIAGSLLKVLSLGATGNTVAGMVGGLLGSAILNSAIGLGHSTALASLDPGAIVSQIAGGGVGGGVMMVLVGIVRQVFTR